MSPTPFFLHSPPDALPHSSSFPHMYMVHMCMHMYMNVHMYVYVYIPKYNQYKISFGIMIYSKIVVMVTQLITLK